jgi:5-hydroxyisourate hydrolase-like protein (transthyretin family)
MYFSTKFQCMMLRKFLLTGFLFISIISSAQQKDTSFTKEWLHIDTLILKNGLTKTALDKVNQLYTKATTQKLPAQKIKCLIYRYSLESIVTEKGPIDIAEDLQQEIKKNTDPVVQSLLRLLLINEWQQYFRNNRWVIYNRKSISNNQDTNIDIWTIDDFRKNIAAQFQEIAKHLASLQKVSIDSYDAIIIRGTKKYKKFDLADLYTLEAISFYKSGDYFVSRTTDFFSIQNPAALSELDTFIKTNFISTDSNAHQWITLNLYQQLLSKHLKDQDPNFLLEIDHERIEWVYQEARFLNKEYHYEKALTIITKKYPTEKSTAAYWHSLAWAEYKKGISYSPFSDTTNRYAFVKAKKIIDHALNTYKDSIDAVQQMRNMRTLIHAKEWQVKTEAVNLIKKKFIASVDYKNIDTLYIRILKLNKDIEQVKTWESAFWKEIVNQSPIKVITQLLPSTNDHQSHRVEIVLPELESGEYALLCSSDPSFNDQKNKLTYQQFIVSNISYIKNRSDIFVLHRETGKPLSNVTVSVLQYSYNKELKKYQYQVLSKKQTDKDGYITFTERQANNNFRYIFETKDDRLAVNKDEYEYYVPSSNMVSTTSNAEKFEHEAKRVLFFTDRSIYRPGQSVFFKGIGITKDYTTKQNKVISSKDSIWVYLQNSTGKKIDSLRLKMNDFGSFSGNFNLPLQGLTGNFILFAYQGNNRSSTSFSVEEYKRPTFSVTLEKPKTAYRLNDSITITGTAKAFSGNNIDGAKVVYNITRTTRFQYPWFWRAPIQQNEKREISNGIMSTDALGNFIIIFKASAEDVSLDKKSNPLFDFSINVSVTDANGETRSGNTEITTGISSIQLAVTVPETVDRNELKEINIQTTNLSNEKEAAIVSIKISELQHTERLIKKRLWERPDQFVMSEQEFTKLFPNDEYKNESNSATWAKGKVIQESLIDTKNTSSLQLTNSLPPGHYELEASTKDKDGNDVSLVTYFKVIDFDHKQLASPDYQFVFTKKRIAKPGDTASFIHATSANDIYVIRKTERLNQKPVIEYQYRKKGLTPITVIPTEEDRGGMMITEAYVIQNRMYTQEYSVEVPWTNKKLDIQYSSYRNKTEPGSKETWTVTVKGNDKEKVNAELLTAMYDASLDQFKTHQWKEPTIWQVGRWANYFLGSNNFGIQESINNYYESGFVERTIESRDRLALYADELIDQNIRYWVRHPSNLFPERFKRDYSYLLEDITSNSYQASRRRTTYLSGTVGGVSVVSEKAIAANAPIGNLSGNTKLGGPEDNTIGFLAGTNDIRIRGANTGSISPDYLLIVDGNVISDISKINPNDIISIEILESSDAIKMYGNRATKGAAIITTKNNQKTGVIIRKDFNETAFFYPQLHADTSGNYSFSFNMPDALTQWKWISFAHTKDLATGTTSTNIITQKTLMVQANTPRFMREGDKIEFSAKVSNLSDQELSGQVMLELVDANVGSSVDGWFQNVFPVQYFTVPAKQSSVVKFPIQIPFSFNRALTWRLVAKAGSYSDGEENTLAVLTNRQLVTESLPIIITKDTTQTFRFEKLINANSPSLTHEALTISYTANPIWEAIRSLPYLMEYPYECVEQTFNRFYANALAHYIINKDPKIKKVFEAWQKDTTALKSKLQLNQSLKQVMLEETPWVFEAATQEQKNKNLALLFDVFRLNQQSEQLINKLQEMQLPDGSFSWFKGGYSDRYMTNYVMTGIGKLKRLGAITPDVAIRLKPIIDNAIKFLDATITKDYRALKANKLDSIKPSLSGFELQYLYMRSFFRDIQQTGSSDAYNYYYELGKNNIQKQSIYNKALLGLIYFRNNEKRFVNVNILSPILENAVEDTSKATIYWKDRSAYSWYTSQIEHQSTVIQFLQEIVKDQNFVGGQKSVDHARNWLLLNKQTNHWNTTVATADAAYALIMTGTDLLHTDKNITIQLGNKVYNNQNNTKEAGTGYFQQRVESRFISPEMGNIQVTVQTKGNASKESISWGAIHWQYFEDMDKITASATPLSITKELFIEKNSSSGKVLEALKENAVVKPGDKVIVRMIIKSDRPMEYLHLKDTRSATMEPVNVLSGFKWQDRLGYYESTKDASTNFFIGQLNKGTYVFDYPVYITHTGVFSTGNASIQCMYAPEFTANSGGMILRVEE